MARCQTGKRVKQCETGFREWEQRVSKWLWIRMDRCVGILIQQSRSFTSNLSHFSSNLSSSPHKQNSSNLSNVISIIVDVSVFNLIIIIIVISILFLRNLITAFISEPIFPPHSKIKWQQKARSTFTLRTQPAALWWRTQG